MKKLFLKVFAVLAVVFAMAGSRAVAQVTITEEPDLSPEYVTSAEDYQGMYQEAINERVEQAALEQQRQIMIIGGVVIVVALVLVFALNRKPKKKKRHW